MKPTNHRMQNGFAAGPVLDMGPYLLNMGQLFGDDPIEVSAVGATAPDSKLGTRDTVSVCLRFSGERMAQFTISYTIPSSERFQLIGTEGEIEASPCFGYGEGMGVTYRATIGDQAKEHSHPVVDPLAGETAYFSDCILNDSIPEPSGEEGFRDVRVLLAVERALATSNPQKLNALPAKTVPGSDQKRQYALAESPDYIDTESPTE